MEYLWAVIGTLIGSIVTILYHRIRFTFGTLRIDRSNPEKDTYRIEIRDDLDLDSLAKKKRIVLKIDNNADLSQE